MKGKLYIVPTPIGNLEDITFRAINILKQADLILAEDTRTSSFLLKHYNIDKPLRSYHQHNEHKTVQDIVDSINAGKIIALVSDAGTPGISDPGFLLVRESLKNNIPVETLPGATAFVPALVNSGLPCDTFVFIGFLPQKKGRQTKLNSLHNEERTMIFYESPFRLTKALEEFKEHFGAERLVSVSRELTKLHEENFRGTVQETLDHFNSKPVKGEIVIVLQGKHESEE
jgi:16S rRNA (cytidine1402-2'-O)-methyltransferase